MAREVQEQLLREDESSSPTESHPKSTKDGKTPNSSTDQAGDSTDDDESLARALQEEENNASRRNRNNLRNTWGERIQRDLLEVLSITDKNKGYFHYRNHFINLDTGTCYIWFSVHAPESEIVVMLDASEQAIIYKEIDGRQDGEVTMVNPFPFEPPRIQFVSGEKALPRRSTIQPGEIMDWQWFRQHMEWSPATRIQRVREIMASSLILDYCSVSRQFPPRAHKRASHRFFFPEDKKKAKEKWDIQPLLKEGTGKWLPTEKADTVLKKPEGQHKTTSPIKPTTRPTKRMSLPPVDDAKMLENPIDVDTWLQESSVPARSAIKDIDIEEEKQEIIDL